MKSIYTKLILLCLLFTGIQSFAANYYWVGGSGDWSQFNLHWASTSGGMVFYSQVPTANDNVIFDANSFTALNQTVTINNGTALCRDMSWLGVQYVPTLTYVYTNQNPYPDLKIFGSLTLSSSMHFYFIGNVTMAATTTGKTIQCNGTGLTNLILNGAGGEWILQDSMHISSFTLRQGTFRTNNNSIVAGDFITASTSTKSLFLGTSRMKVTNWTTPTALSTFSAQNSIITCSQMQLGGGQWYGKIIVPTDYFPEINGASNTRINLLEVASSNTSMDVSIITKIYSFDATCDLVTATNVGFGKLIVRENYTEGGACSFDTLMLRNGGYSALFYPTGTHTITSYMDAQSSIACQQITVSSTSTSASAVFSKASGTVTCNDLSISRITATGGASFIANNSVAGVGVVGWTINGAPGPRTLYWIGGSGNWNSISHWSSSSGGPANQCYLPGSLDDVIFDANSLPISSQQVTFNIPTIGVNNITWTGYSGSRTFVSSSNVTLNVYGSWQGNASVNWQVTGTVEFTSSSTGKTIRTNGAVLPSIILNTTGGGWSLLDPLSCSALTVTRGFFDTQGNSINCSGAIMINNNTANSIELHTSNITAQTINLLANITANSIDADSAVFNCVDLGTNRMHLEYIEASGTASIDNSTIDTLVITGNGQVMGNSSTIDYLHFITDGTISYTYNLINHTRADRNLNILGNANLGTLELNNPGYSVLIQPGSYIDLSGTIIANGTCGNPITIACNTVGYTARFVKSSGTVSVSGMIIRDVITQGGATFNAYQSTGLSITTGWNIYAGASSSLYWVGGSGNWNDPQHWSLSSGGAGGNCLPTLSDDVIFDAASVSGTDIVNVTDQIIYCKDLTWSGISGTPTFRYTGSLQHEFQIAGSIQIQPAVNWIYNGTLHFLSAGMNKTVDFGGHYVPDLLFDGMNSHWTLQDSIHADTLILTHGSLATNSHLIRVPHIFPYGDTLILDSSLVISEEWDAQDQYHSNILVLPNNHSTIIAKVFISFAAQYNKVWGVYHFHAEGCHIREFISDSTHSLLIDNNIFNTGSNDTIDHAIIKHEVQVNGRHRFGCLELTSSSVFNNALFADTLWCNNPGSTITIHKDSTITIGQEMWFNSSIASPIILRSSIPGGTAKLSKATDTICGEHLVLSDIHAIGGATFYAGMYSVNNGNNTGWAFQSCSQASGVVWPGDVNEDFVVDNLDALYLGIAYGTSSYTRPSANISWSAQPCLDWPYVYTNLVNVKNADCDGNGLVDTLDVLAIQQNYGMTRPPIAPPQQSQQPQQQLLSVGVPLFFQPSTSNYAAGDTVTIPFYLGNSAMPATSVYGLASHILYDNSRIVPGSVSVTLGNSWLAPSGNRLELIYDNLQASRVEFSDSRTDRQNVSGDGQIGFIRFILDTNAADSVQLYFSDSYLLDVNQNNIALDQQSVTIYITSPAPVALFSGTPTVLCEGGSVAYTDLSSNSPTSWAWTFPGGIPSTSTSQNPTVVYNSAGTYAVSLTATNADGSGFVSFNGYITVNANPNASASVTDVTCNGGATGSIDLTPSGGTGPYTFLWNPSAQTTEDRSALVASTYSVSVTDANGCVSQTSYVVTQPSAINALMSKTDASCANNDGTATATPLGGTVPYTYAWSPGGQTTQIATGLAGGTYTCTITDANGCISLGNITVNQTACGPTRLTNATCGITVSSFSQQVFCIAIPGATNYRYRWTNAAQGFNFVFVRNSNQTNCYPSWITGIQYGRTYNVEVSAFVGSAWTPYGTICTVTTPPAIPSTQLIPSDCGSSVASFNELIYATAVTGATQYEWRVSHPATSFSVTYLRIANTADLRLQWINGIQYGLTYNIEVRAYVGGVWGAFGNVCTVTAPPFPTTQLTPTYCGATTAAVSSPIYCNPVQNATNYQWKFINTSIGYSSTMMRGSGLTSWYMSSNGGILTNTTYTVTVRAYVGGVWGTFGPPCTITTGPVQIAPNESQAEAMRAQEEICAANPGMCDAATELTMDVYPNPFAENITVMTDASVRAVLIYNSFGEFVRSVDLENGKAEINLGDLASGIYLIQATTAEGVITKRVVKQ